MTAKTLFDKIWESHMVYEEPGKPTLLYIDLHLVHEVTSPQAFEGLRLSGRRVRRPDLIFATMDHNVPTSDRSLPIEDPISAKQIETLRKNCKEFGITLFDLKSPHQGIVHVIGPELGLTKPGMTIVCGDSHTSTHGALGALAIGIGTSEVEHVLVTQCLLQNRPKVFEVRVEGLRARGVTAKDIFLSIIGHIGTAGATGTVVEYRGDAIEALSMEERMTICNMSIEAGARAGMIAPDEKTFDYLEGRSYAPKGKDFERSLELWKQLKTDDGAIFDKRVFIGSCTNSRLEDLTAAARVVKGKKVTPHVRAMVVPGSQSVKREAEKLGIDKIYKEAGFEWRESGCSMCLGMNPDILAPGERCASTSNRNFEGRQGKGGRTHLVSPIMAAAAAIEGHFVDIREWRLDEEM